MKLKVLAALFLVIFVGCTSEQIPTEQALFVQNCLPSCVSCEDSDALTLQCFSACDAQEDTQPLTDTCEASLQLLTFPESCAESEVGNPLGDLTRRLGIVETFGGPNDWVFSYGDENAFEGIVRVAIPDDVGYISGPLDDQANASIIVRSRTPANWLVEAHIDESTGTLRCLSQAAPKLADLGFPERCSQAFRGAPDLGLIERLGIVETFGGPNTWVFTYGDETAPDGVRRINIPESVGLIGGPRDDEANANIIVRSRTPAGFYVAAHYDPIANNGLGSVLCLSAAETL